MKKVRDSEKSVESMTTALAKPPGSGDPANSQKLRDRHDPATPRTDDDEAAAAKQCGIPKAALSEARAIRAGIMSTRKERDAALDATFMFFLKHWDNRSFDAFFRSQKLGKPGPKSKNPWQCWINWTFGEFVEESTRRWYGKALLSTYHFRAKSKKLVPSVAIKTIGGGDYTALVEAHREETEQPSDTTKRDAKAKRFILAHVNGIYDGPGGLDSFRGE
jgi:hypothetical protein